MSLIETCGAHRGAGELLHGVRLRGGHHFGAVPGVDQHLRGRGWRQPTRAKCYVVIVVKHNVLLSVKRLVMSMGDLSKVGTNPPVLPQKALQNRSVMARVR